MKSCEDSIIFLFFVQILSISNSTGSIISEILGLFKTFQRISAPKSFIIKFSHEALSLFTWAARFVEIITNLWRTDPLTEYDIFYTYNIVIPLSILMYISSLLSGGGMFINAIVYLIFLGLGAGIGFFEVDLARAIILTISAVILICIGFFITRSCNFDASRIIDNDQIGFYYDRFIYSLSFIPSAFVFFFLMFPITLGREKLANFISVLIAIIFVIIFIVELVINYFFEKNIDKFLSFLFNCFSLLIIPSINSFYNLISSDFEKDWRIILTFSFLSLALPITLSIISIITSLPSLEDKYYYCFVEFIDISRQIVYAFLASYDIIWGCFGVELAWIIFICILRPYKNKSDYPLSIGNSFVITASNCALLHAKYKDDITISFDVAITIFVFAFIPVIAALYVFFCIDFTFTNNNSDGNLNESVEYLTKLSRPVTPFAWVCFGIHMPFLVGDLIHFKF